MRDLEQLGDELADFADVRNPPNAAGQLMMLHLLERGVVALEALARDAATKAKERGRG